MNESVLIIIMQFLFNGLFQGMVIRCSAIIPDCKMAFFRLFSTLLYVEFYQRISDFGNVIMELVSCRCVMCHHAVDVLIDRGRIEEPTSCPDCRRVGSMELVHNRYAQHCAKLLLTFKVIPNCYC